MVLQVDEVANPKKLQDTRNPYSYPIRAVLFFNKTGIKSDKKICNKTVTAPTVWTRRMNYQQGNLNLMFLLSNFLLQRVVWE